MREIRNQKVRDKALIAIVLSGGVSGVQVPAACAEEQHERVGATIPIAQQIVNSNDEVPFTKAYKLLKLSEAYLSYRSRGKAERRTFGESYKPSKGWKPGEDGRFNLIAWLSDDIALRQNEIGVDSHQQQLLANETLKKAVEQIELISEPDRRLKLYFIASMLYRESNDSENFERCNKIVDEKLDECINHSCSDEKQMAAAVFVLNSRAFALLPYAVGDLQQRMLHSKRFQSYEDEESKFVGPVSPESFKKAEKLRLEALAIADQLDAKSDARRRAHRDMAIWYRGLGQAELFQKEKETLFELVGFRDDALLYSEDGMCGSEIWWEPKHKTALTVFCGMG